RHTRLVSDWSSDVCSSDLIQQWSELPRGEDLFRSLVVFENAPIDPTLGQQVGDVRLAFEHDRVHTNYPLTVVAYPGARLGLRLRSEERRVGEAWRGRVWA